MEPVRLLPPAPQPVEQKVHPEAPRPPQFGAHAELVEPLRAAIPVLPSFEPETPVGHLHPEEQLMRDAMRESGGLLPYDSDSSLEDRALKIHAEHARAITLMVTTAIKGIPGIQVEGSLSRIMQKGREWTATGLAVTLPDNLERKWHLSFEGTQTYRGGAYSGPKLAGEGANYTLTAEDRATGLVISKSAWDEEKRSTVIGLDSQHWVRQLNEKAKEYEEDAE